MGESTGRPTRGELRAARAVAAVGVVVWCGIYFGVVDLLTPLEQAPGFSRVYLLEAGWGLLFTVLVSFPLLVLVFRPGAPALLAQVTVVGLAVGLTAMASGQLAQLVPAAVLVLNAAFAADLARGYVRPPGGWAWPQYDQWVLGAVVVAVPVAANYAWDAMRTFHAAEGPVDETMGLDHWPVQAALHVAIVLVATVVAAGVALGWAGTLVSALSVSVTAMWLGATSIAYPTHAASLGDIAGAAAVFWGLGFGALAVLRRGARSETAYAAT